MNELKNDENKVKTNIRNDWNHVASGWQKWLPFLEKGAHPVTEKLIGLAGIKEGNHVLDIATGLGEPALTVAKCVGENGRIVATDFSPQMLKFAKERANSLGLNQVIFHESDGEVLDIPEQLFNAVVCRWGLMFFPNLQHALTRIHELLESGGKLATAVWDIPQKVPMINISMKVIMDKLKLPPPPKEKPSPFSLANVDLLESAMKKAGFKDIFVERVTVSVHLPSPEDYTQFTQDVSGPIISLLANQPESKKKEIWLAITEEAKNYAQEDNSIRMNNEAICFVASK